MDAHEKGRRKGEDYSAEVQTVDHVSGVVGSTMAQAEPRSEMVGVKRLRLQITLFTMTQRITKLSRAKMRDHTV